MTLRLMGCILLVAAGAMGAWQRINALHCRERTLFAFAAALRRGAAELEAHRTPTGELLELLAMDNDPGVSRFFGQIYRDMDREGPAVFSSAWNRSVQGCTVLEPGERQTLTALGQVLGQYGVGDTCAALKRCGDFFQQEGEQVRRQIPEQTRVYLGVGLSWGAIAGILLI